MKGTEVTTTDNTGLFIGAGVIMFLFAAAALAYKIFCSLDE